MGLDDFCLCYVEEFEAILGAWGRMRQDASRERWEQVRISAAVGISPHVRKPIAPKELLPMPWDSSSQPDIPESRPMTHAERMDRARRMAERLGYEIS